VLYKKIYKDKYKIKIVVGVKNWDKERGEKSRE
jgi:hypothetical protein